MKNTWQPQSHDCSFSWTVARTWWRDTACGNLTFFDHPVMFLRETPRQQKCDLHLKNPVTSMSWDNRGIPFQWLYLPSGKRLHNYGKSPFSMGKSTINGPFSIAMLNYQRVPLACEKQESGLLQTAPPLFILFIHQLNFRTSMMRISRMIVALSCWVAEKPLGR